MTPKQLGHSGKVKILCFHLVFCVDPTDTLNFLRMSGILPGELVRVSSESSVFQLLKVYRNNIASMPYGCLSLLRLLWKILLGGYKQHIFISHSSGTWKSRIKYQQSWLPQWWLSSHCKLTRQMNKLVLCGLFHKGTYPNWKSSVFMVHLPPKGPTSLYYHREYVPGFQYMDLGETQTFRS